MWIDTHCHLDAPELASFDQELISHSIQNGVDAIIIPAIHRDNFEAVKTLAHQFSHTYYAVGIHPVYIKDAKDDDLKELEVFLKKHQDDPKLVAIGEIGLDFYIPELKEGPLREKQERFYAAQLHLAKQFQLPVLLHSRRAVDGILKELRKIKVTGIAHAFNGSFQQAQTFIDLGFVLSFCGTATYERAQHLRQLVQKLPKEALVIETDAPDLKPSWLDARPNTPTELPKIGQYIAALRGMNPNAFAQLTTQNAKRILKRIQ